MKKKFLYLVVSGLMVLFLVMAACGPAAVPTAPTTPTTPTATTAPTAPTAPVQEKPQKEVVAPSSEAPKYGGTLTVRLASDPTCCDSMGKTMKSSMTFSFVHQQYVGADWTRGPAGTGDFNYRVLHTPEGNMGPELAESMKVPEQGVWILNIRKGVHWQLPNTEAGRLVGGREMTVDDIIWSFNRLTYDPDSAILVRQPRVARAATIEKTGPWQVTIRTPVDHVTGLWWIVQGGGHNAVYPPEAVKKYGNNDDWRNQVGTGPFMLVEYVAGSQALYVRNPSYWETNTLGPGKGDQLPYIERIRRLVIPDMSTTLAALRTAKIDVMDGVNLEDGESVLRYALKMEKQFYLPNTGYAINFRLDDPKLPWRDVRVRQALTMATNFEAFRAGLYGGKAETDIFLTNPNFGTAHMPLNEMPESVQSLYRYNPEKAKQLMKEAGYPNGFKAEVLVENVPSRIDELAIFKDMWSKVGVELTMKLAEAAMYNQLTGTTFKWSDMFYGTDATSTDTTLYTYLGRNLCDNRPQCAHRWDRPDVSDARLEATFKDIDRYMFVDMPKVYQAVRQLRPYVVEQAFKVIKPEPYAYSLWWPWLKNTYGQGANNRFLKYYWIDQDLKKKMGF